MLVSLQLVNAVAAVPLKVTVLVPCEAPKFTPVIVSDDPTVPAGSERLEMSGRLPTANGRPLLATPPTVTTTLPEVGLACTVTEMLVGPQLVTVAAVPLKVTVLVPCDEPKFTPVMV